MISYKTKLGTAFATFSLMASVMAPAASADTMVTIAGNGNNSTNNVNVTNNSSVNVTQNNTVNVSLDITSKANTGGNKANKNNGGNVTIDTGNATSNVTIAVEGGSNMAEVPCACGSTNDTVDIKDNGNNSDNSAYITNKNKKKVEQKSKVKVDATVKSKAKTGKNKANGNNQPGNVEVTTGNSNSTVDAVVTAPSNEVTLTP